MAHAYISRRRAQGVLLKKQAVVSGQSVGVQPSKGMDARQSVSRNKSFLEVFASSKGNQLLQLAKTATKAQLLAICDVVLNYTHGVISSDVSFERNRKFLNAVIDPKVSLELKRQLLVESVVYRNIIKRLLANVLEQL